jgi:hypothetical protein
MSDLRYPTGRFQAKGAPLSGEERRVFTERIRELPTLARAAVAGLTDAQLDTPYREGGWSPRQIIHHLADSHLNAFARTKLALTAERPTITPYDQGAWAELADVRGVPVEASLAVLDGLHERWSLLLDALDPDDFARQLKHPEMGDIDVDLLLQLYAWHGSHHVTQIRELRKRRGW